MIGEVGRPCIMSVSRKHRGLVPLLVGGLLAGGPAEAGCIRFAAAKSFPTLVQQPDGILVTDLDGDGRADIVVSDSQFGELETRLGRGDGTFRVGTGLVDVSEVTGGLAAGDLDGDGRTDLAVAEPLVTADGGHGAAILLNRGVNRFHQKGLPARQEVTDLAL